MKPMKQVITIEILDNEKKVVDVKDVVFDIRITIKDNETKKTLVLTTEDLLKMLDGITNEPRN